MSKLNIFKSNLNHIRKNIFKSKFLILLYLLILAFGFLTSVFISRYSADIRSEANTNPVWHCNTQIRYSMHDCKTENWLRNRNNGGDGYTFDSRKNPHNYCVDVGEVNDPNAYSFKFYTCNCVDNCSSLTPTATPPNSPTPIPTATPTTGPSTTPTRGPTSTPRPTATPTPVLGTKGCGISCGSDVECQSGFSCEDPNVGHNVCWNAGICGGPALKSRVEGVVRGCNNEPLQGVPVWAWGNVNYTDQNGKFQLNKGVNRNSEGDITLNETSIMAGNDVIKDSTDPRYLTYGYFDSSTDRQYDALQLRSGSSCALVNCIFGNRVGDGLNISNSHKLLVGGPTRTAYRLGRRSTNPNQGLTDELFEDNFVFTDYHAKSFNFKRVGCPTVPPPTLTPPPLYTCNQTCTLNSQCETTNPNWFCAQTYDFDTSGWAEETGYFNPSYQGKITGLNLHLTSNGKIAEHIIKEGRIYYRPEFNAAISDVTHNVNDAGCANQPNITVDACTALAGTIIDFNSYLHILRIDGVDRSVTEQHVIRKKSNGEVNLYSRDVIHGVEDWTQSWNLNTYFSTNLITGSKDNVTAFTSFFQNVDDFRIQNVVGGGVVFQRALGIYGWGNTMAQFTWCTTNGLCGYNPNGTGNPILAFEQVEWGNGNISRYIVRKDGRVYKNVGYKLDQKCRVKNDMWNQFNTNRPYTCS